MSYYLITQFEFEGQLDQVICSLILKTKSINTHVHTHEAYISLEPCISHIGAVWYLGNGLSPGKGFLNL